MKAKLTKRDRQLVDELSRPLAVWAEGEASPLHAWIANFSASVGLTKALLYGLQPEADGYLMPFHFVHRTMDSVDFLTPYQRFLESSSRRWGFFDPLRPEPAQRNKVVTFEPHVELASRLQRGDAHDPTVRRSVTTESIQSVARTSEFFVRIGVGHEWQMRALLCDGESLLGWLGGYAPELPHARHQEIFQRLVPAIAHRLKLEQLLSTAPHLKLLLVSALEEVPAPAFVLAPGGRLELANRHGQALVDRSPTTMRSELGEVLRYGGGRGYRVTTVRAGTTEYKLLIGPRPSPLHERLAVAGNAWGLTPRQAEVLGHLIGGDANKVIANKLGCSTHTIELHVTALLQKAQVESRAELSARFWMRL